jgi:Pyruvate/2-oxoacid:ferredoxin oxidoreductase delta subunit/thioredoxin reductase
MRYGIPAYRTPRHVLDAEVERILELGVSVFTGTKIGVDVSLANLEREFDAVFIGLGAQNGVPLPVPGADKAPNCISGIAFLNAFNDGRLRHVAARVVVVGGGDTAMDVAAVARRLGHIGKTPERDRPEYVVLGQTEHDVAMVAKREGADVMVAYRRPIEKMPAARQEIEHVLQEGVQIRGSVAPVEVVLGSDGRAKALRVVEVDWVSGKMQPRSGSEFDIECDLIVAAVGQTGDFTGMEELDNGSGLINVGERYRWPGRPGIFVGGDVVRPHLLTSAIGHARIAAASIDHFVLEQPADKRPKIDVVQFNLLRELNQRGLEPGEYDHQQVRGTAVSDFAVHNYDDRSSIQIVTHDELFKGHFPYAARQRRMERQISADAVLGDLTERVRCLTEEQAVAEAQRCMSCGLCFECDNCLIYCPQAAVLRFPKKERAVGHYVYTDYAKCIGCHICRDVCPAGYIQMGMGE